MAFAVDDVDACLRRLLDNGGSAVNEVIRGSVEGVEQIHLVYAKDPEGTIIKMQKWECSPRPEPLPIGVRLMCESRRILRRIELREAVVTLVYALDQNPGAFSFRPKLTPPLRRP